MKGAVKLGQSLVLNADTSSPEVLSLRQEVKEIPDKFDNLKARLTEQQVQLESIIHDSSVFNQHIRELELWVTEVSESTAMQDPISTNPKVVNKTLELTEVSVVGHHWAKRRRTVLTTFLHPRRKEKQFLTWRLLLCSVCVKGITFLEK